MKAYLKNEISGTDFIELQKGKYNNLHFKEDSIYFCEEDFKPCGKEVFGVVLNESIFKE